MKRLGVAALTVALAACSRVENVGSRFVKSQDVGAANGALISVSAAEEATLAGTQLDIPAGALAFDTRITLEVGGTALSSSAAGPVAVWGPAGTHFSKSAHMTLPVILPGDAIDEDVYIEVLEANGAKKTIDTVSLSGALASFDVDGFTAFQASTHSCTADTQCTNGKTCVAGRCRRSHGQQCSTSLQCGQGSQCLSGTCQPNSRADGGPLACVTYLDCGGIGTQCVNGTCQPLVPRDDAGVQCATSRDCGGIGTQCLNGTCQPLVPPDDAGAQCTSYLDCGGVGTQCVNGTCQPLVPPDDAGVQCATDLDCGGIGTQCLNGTCQPLVPPDDAGVRCATYLDCGGIGTQCLNGTCQPLVPLDGGP